MGTHTINDYDMGQDCGATYEGVGGEVVLTRLQPLHQGQQRLARRQEQSAWDTQDKFQSYLD